MPRKQARSGKPARRITPVLAGSALLLLGGCDAIYDDTKGWANRLEASILEAAHKMGEPVPETTARVHEHHPPVGAASRPRLSPYL